MFYCSSMCPRMDPSDGEIFCFLKEIITDKCGRLQFKELYGPNLCGSVGGASTHKVKGHPFHSRSRHTRGALYKQFSLTLMLISLSISLPSPLSRTKWIKYLKLIKIKDLYLSQQFCVQEKQMQILEDEGTSIRTLGEKRQDEGESNEVFWRQKKSIWQGLLSKFYNHLI